MVYIVLGTGFEPVEAVAPCDILRRGGVEVQFAGIGGTQIEGGHGIRVQADCRAEEMNLDAAEMVILPGGMGGVRSILADAHTLAFVREAYAAGKYVAAICAAPSIILGGMGLLEGRRATCYPGMEDGMTGATPVKANAVTDGKIITGCGVGGALDFACELITALCGKVKADEIAESVVHHVYG